MDGSLNYKCRISLEGARELVSHDGRELLNYDGVHSMSILRS